MFTGGIPCRQVQATLNGKIPESIIDLLVNFTPDITFTKTYDQFPCVFRYMAGYIEQIVDHSLVSAPLDASFQTGISSFQRFCSIMRRMLYDSMVSSSTSSLVSDFPDGRRSRSISFLSSL